MPLLVPGGCPSVVGDAPLMLASSHWPNESHHSAPAPCMIAMEMESCDHGNHKFCEFFCILTENFH